MSAASCVCVCAKGRLNWRCEFKVHKFAGELKGGGRREKEVAMEVMTMADEEC